jgi:hypothetical protein
MAEAHDSPSTTRDRGAWLPPHPAVAASEPSRENPTGVALHGSSRSRSSAGRTSDLTVARDVTFSAVAGDGQRGQTSGQGAGSTPPSGVERHAPDV